MLKADNVVSSAQYLVASLISWCIIFLLIVRYFQIQVINNDSYSKKANSNRIRKITKTAPRGLILDRNGQILVDNYPTYVLTAIPWELSDKEGKFSIISQIIGLNKEQVEENYKKYYRGRFNQVRIAKDLNLTNQFLL